MMIHMQTLQELVVGNYDSLLHMEIFEASLGMFVTNQTMAGIV